MSLLPKPPMAILRMQGITKRFGSTQALAGVDLELQAGEVHALVGENGAGKSTLMKVLSGAVRPDRGEMTLDGRPYAPGGPAEARQRGVAMVYQELTLAPDLSVEANILLGVEPTRWGFLRPREGRRRVREVLALLDHPEIQPESSVARLNPAAQQLVEIARALLLKVRVLVLDEPTSSLSQHDTQRLFELIHRVRDQGVSVVYISHFLEEVEQIADRFTVLRDGSSVAHGPRSEFVADRIIEWMVGRSLTDQFPHVSRVVGEPVLELSDLVGQRFAGDVNLTLRRGEILGLAGLVGAGRTELLRAVFGLDAVVAGQVVFHRSGSSVVGIGYVPGQRIRQGMGMLSENRKEEGLALNQSICDNLTYSRLRPYNRAGVLRLGQRRRQVADWLDRLGVRYREVDQAVGELSGGNQQKVALGRLLHQQAEVLLLDEPTRGVDIGSKQALYQVMGELAAEGKAILFVSSYLPELLGICDRIAVMSRGRVVGVRPTTEWTPEDILAQATQSVADESPEGND